MKRMKIRKKLHLSAKRCIFALLNDNLTIRVSFPSGQAEYVTTQEKATINYDCGFFI